MRLLKFGVRPGLIASALIAALLLIVAPFSYDRLGEGPQAVKAAVNASKEAREVCGELGRFVLIPWRLSLDHTSSQGSLDLAYWVSCEKKNRNARLEASLSHSGGAWQIKSIDLIFNDERVGLASGS
jgi:ATP-dependent RNA circularization protein (DNA/RNA ligase family)